MKKITFVLFVLMVVGCSSVPTKGVTDARISTEGGQFFVANNNKNVDSQCDFLNEHAPQVHNQIHEERKTVGSIINNAKKSVQGEKIDQNWFVTYKRMVNDAGRHGEMSADEFGSMVYGECRADKWYQ